MASETSQSSETTQPVETSQQSLDESQRSRLARTFPFVSDVYQTFKYYKSGTPDNSSENVSTKTYDTRTSGTTFRAGHFQPTIHVFDFDKLTNKTGYHREFPKKSATRVLALTYSFSQPDEHTYNVRFGGSFFTKSKESEVFTDATKHNIGKTSQERYLNAPLEFTIHSTKHMTHYDIQSVLRRVIFRHGVYSVEKYAKVRQERKCQSTQKHSQTVEQTVEKTFVNLS